MAKKVKALQTIAGGYGTKTPDDEAFAIDDKLAAELEAKGLVKIVGSAKDEEESKATNMSTEKNIIKDNTKTSPPQQVNIKDNTAKTKAEPVIVKEKAETKKVIPTQKKRK